MRTLRTLRPPTIPSSRPGIDQNEDARDDLVTSAPDDDPVGSGSSEIGSSGIRPTSTSSIGWHQVGLHLRDVLGR